MKKHTCQKLMAVLLFAGFILQGHAQQIIYEIIYVNKNAPANSLLNGTSWANAYTNLQQAITNANPTFNNPAEIWVAVGTYFPTAGINRNASFELPSNMHIIGGFVGTETSDEERLYSNIYRTVLSGDIGVRQAQRIEEARFSSIELGFGSRPDPADPGFADNVYTVVRAIGISNSVLDGVVIAGGFADGPKTNGQPFTVGELQDMSLPAGTNIAPTVNTNFFRRGEAIQEVSPAVAGGGLFVSDRFERSSNIVNLIVNNCVIVGNLAMGYGGGMAGREANVQIATTRFENNIAGIDGGGAWGQNFAGAFQDCYFTGNKAEGAGGGLQTEIIPSDKTFPKGISDAEAFKRGNGISADDFGKIVQTSISAYKVAPKIYTALTSSPNAMAGVRHIMPTAPWTKYEVDATGQPVLDPLGKPKPASFGSKVAGVYAYISIAVTVVDFGMAMAEAFGGDMDNDFVQGWMTFSENFNKYATVAGLTSMAVLELEKETQIGAKVDDWIISMGGGSSLEQQGHFHKKWQLDFYNLSPVGSGVSLLGCTFAGNESGYGGGLAVTYDNVFVENCMFQENRSRSDGGAIYQGAWNSPFIISSAFVGNRSSLGESAIANIGHCRAQIINCTLIDNYSDSTNGYAMGNHTGSHVRLANSIFWGNSNAAPATTNGGADIFTATKAFLTSEPEVLDAYNKAGPAYGDWVAICDISHCIIQGLNEMPEGTDEILLFDEPINLYTRAEISQRLVNRQLAEENGIFEAYGFINAGQGNRPGFKTNKGNRADNPMLDGITPSGLSPAINAGNYKRLDNGIVNSWTGQDIEGEPRLVGSTYDIGAVERSDSLDGTAVYVRTSAPGSNNSGTNWFNAKTNLQEALSLSNRIILVAEGIYRPSNTGDRFASFSMGENVQVYGGFKADGSHTNLSQRDPALHETILSGDIGVIGNDSDNSYNVMRNLNVGFSAILDGFTVTKGRAEGGRSGGGINNSSSWPQIVNCRFIDNRADWSGGAIYNTGEYGSQLRNCTFIDNEAGIGGGALKYLSELRIENSIFENNRSSLGGAINVGGGKNTLIYNSRFVNNSVTGNISGAKGGAIDASDTKIRIHNSTFYRNYINANIAESRGGGAINFYGNTGQSLIIENNIFWNNFVANTSAPPASIEKQQIAANVTFPQGPAVTAPVVLAFNNIIEGLEKFTDLYSDSNLDADPQFIDAAGGDLNLASYSQAIDAGRDKSVLQTDGTYYFNPSGIPLLDLAGNPRFSSAHVDIGAYEFQGTPTPVATDINIASDCNEDTLTFNLVYSGTNGAGLNFQWQVNKNDGTGFASITNGGIYSGVTTTNLIINNPTVAMNGYRYRIVITGEIGLTSQSTFITVRPNRFYVREGGAGNRNGSSWTNAFANIHDALAAATECSQIWVAAGTYHPPTGQFALDNALRMRSGIAIYGGFAGTETNLNQRNWRTNVTMISGNIGNPFSSEDDSTNLFYNLGNQTGFACDETAILDGFTLRAARDTAMVISSASPTIRNVIFENNEGGFGGAVKINDGSPRFLHCEFRNNISGNGGAAHMNTATAYFDNCVFHRNISGHLGGAISAFSSELHLRNNTVADNQASTLGGGIYLQNSHAHVGNSIIWGNAHGDSFLAPISSQLHGEGVSSLNVSNSAVQFGGGLPGGNIRFNPLFTNAPSGDLRLLVQSPAINAGNNDDATGLNFDLDGAARVAGGTIDIGAYEYQGANPTSTVHLVTQPSSVSVCTSSGSISFFVSGATNTIFDWEVSTGGPFIAITNDATYTINTNATSSTLTIANPNLSLSGNQYRAVVRDTGYATPPATLTVNVPMPLFVRHNAAGTNDGSSWFNAFTNLQSALNVATPCNEIWVAMGTYRSSGSNFDMRPGVAIYGGFIGFEVSRELRNPVQNQTILVANTNQSVFVNNSIYHGALNRNAMLDGFILRSSNAINPVIYNVNVSPTIQNCVFDAPAGMAIANQFASPLITNCVFSNGRAVAVFNSGSSPSILNSVFRGNTNAAAGGAIANYSSSPLIDNCRFETNSAVTGGAIINSGFSSPTITRSVFLRNRARNGAGAVANQSSGDVRIENSLFAYNESDHLGGAMEQSQGSLTLLHVTMTENRSANGGGGIYVYGGNINIRNSILWNNEVRNTSLALNHEQQQIQISSGSPVIQSTCIKGNLNYGGNGNSAYDPLFSATAQTNTFPLDPASPSLNAGNNAFSTNLTVDLAGAPRLSFGTVDMGAYESAVSPQAQVRLLNTVSDQRVCSGDNATFAVTADVTQTNALQWQVDTSSGFVNVVNDGTHVITVNGLITTLQVSNVGPAMNGWHYRIHVSESAFSSHPMTLVASAPTVLYVNAAASGGNGLSWTNAFTNLQQALNIADHCSEIWVAQGTYPVITSAIGENYFPLKPSVEIYGGFFGNEATRNARNPAAHPTILIGQADSPATLMARGDTGLINATTVLDGFIIEAMNGDGIFNYQASPTIRNCTIRNVPGAGMWNEINSSPLIENCVFTGNQSGGIENRNGSSPAITGCTFNNNHHPISGGAIANVFAGNPIVTTCVFSNNTAVFHGGAIYSDSNSSITVRLSRFMGNSAGQFGGGVHLQSVNTVLEQLVMFGNSATRGGAISLAGTTVNLVNSTVADNSALIEGSSISVQGGAMHLRNSVVWNNAINGTHTATNSWIQTASVAEPLFLNPLAGDYRLSAFSPLLNAGNNSFVTPAMTVDVAGNVRVFDSTVDIGAYEWQSAAQSPVLIAAAPVSQLSGCFGNPAVFSVMGTISGASVVWQMDQGVGFSDVAGSLYSVNATSNSSILTITGLPSATNYLVRYRLSGNAYTSAPVRLSISSPQIVYVNHAAIGTGNGASWANAFTNLQEAIAASDCAEFWVASGTYIATGTEANFGLRSTLSIYGGFNGTESSRSQRNWTNNVTVLTSALTNSSVVFNNGLNQSINFTAVLDGFTIAGHSPLAAIVNLNASPVIQNCVVAGHPGYGVLNQSGSPAYMSCLFSNNLGGAVFNAGATATFTDCQFVGNQTPYSGAAMANRQATSVVERCVFENNSAARGGAVANLEGGFSIISRSRFSGNSALFEGGAIYNSQAGASVRNSILTGNRANSFGGALAQYSGGLLEIVNSTITRNTAASLGGGLYLQTGQAQIRNSILWANSVSAPQQGATLQDAQFENNNGTLSASHSIIEGLTDVLGVNNRNADPLFGASNLIPGAFSPAIDHGDNAFVALDDLDFAGSARQIGPNVDIGAYESLASYSNTLNLAQFPQPIASCDGNAVNFSVVAASGTNYVVQWQRSSAGPFANLVSGGVYNISTNGAEHRLEILPVSTAMNGDQFRFVIASINYTSPPVTLTVSSASVIYVNATNATPGNGSSWAQAVNTLSNAINLWTECAEIWVAAGTYMPTNTLHLRTPMRIYGGFAGNETLRSERNWSNNLTRIVAFGDLPAFENNPLYFTADRLAIMDGLVFSGATNVAVVNAVASPTFRNCTFESNVTAVINRNGASPLFENCRFLNNSNAFGGAVYNLQAQPVFNDCFFSGNKTSGRGGAISFVGGGGVIVNTRFETNRADTIGGAISAEFAAQLEISRAQFIGNSAADQGGALFVLNATAKVANSLFAVNRSEHGGGAVMSSGSSLSIVNSTIADNETYGRGGGIEQFGGSIVVTNSIFWGNRDLNSDQSLEVAQVRVLNGTTAISHSIVGGLETFSGNNNLLYDPLFVQAATGDYRIRSYSPALNSGANISTAGALDLDGSNRIVAAVVDLGAYEFQGAGDDGTVRLLLMPQSVKVCTGSSEKAIFTVTGENNPTLQYIWEINTGSGWQGSINTNDGLHSLSSTDSSSTLTVSNLSLAQNGNRYRFRIVSPAITSPFYPDTNGVLLTVTGPSVIYVKHNATGNQSGSSWTNAFTNLHDALDNAASCSEIWVASGTYRPQRLGANSYAANLKDGVEIYGGFSGTETLRSERNWTNNPTILRGDYRASVLSALGFYNTIGTATLLDGFTIQADGAVSGLSIVEASPTIRNCRFENLIAYALPISVNASPRIEDSIFTNNHETAIDVRDHSTVTISNVLFIGNSTEGQGAAIHSMRTSSVHVAYSRFADNTSQYGGGAVLSQEGGTFSAFNCVFTNNTAWSQGGGAQNIFADMFFTNCLFAANQSFFGGALANYGNLTLVNCTVSDNSATYAGSGIYQVNATNTMRNTILWGNADTYAAFGNLERAQIENVSGTVLANHSIIRGLNVYAGNANVPYDPLFTNSLAGNYQLDTYFSPARNAGNNTYIAGVTNDLAGAQRIFDPSVDIGAFEIVGGVSLPVQILSHPQSQTSCPGGTVAFNVTGASGLGSKVTWRVKPLNESGFAPINPNANYSIITTDTSSTLVVSNLATFDGYQFRYHYATAFDPYRSAPVTLTVNDPTVIYVRANAPANGDGQSWATAYNSLQTALAAANLCRPEIWIAAGTYYPTTGTNQNDSFTIPNGIRVYGGFAGTETLLSQRNWTSNQVVLSGDIGTIGNTNDNSSHVVLFDGLEESISQSTILDGATIERGQEAGMLIFYASPTVRNCVVRSNNGSGLNVTGGGSRVEQSTFHSNRGSGGVYVTDATNAAFVNCRFSGNTSTSLGGGIALVNSTVGLTNCLSSGNTGSLGAGVGGSGGAVSMINCTVVGNASTGSAGAGLGAVSGNWFVRNSILWGNRATASENEAAQLSFSGAFNVGYTAIQGLSNFNANFNQGVDPVFVAPVSATAAPTLLGDYTLGTCSALLNDADASVLAGLTNDLAGNSRQANGGPDIGAFELQTPGGDPVYITSQPTNVIYCASQSNYFEVIVSFPDLGSLTYQWQMLDTNSATFLPMTNNAVFSGAVTARLGIQSPTADLSGAQFRLLVTTPVGCSAISQTVQLGVPSSQTYVRANAPAGGDGISWATAYNDLKIALASTCAPELWVAEGTYSNSTSFGLRNGVAIYGGFAGTETNRNQRNWVTHPTKLSSSDWFTLDIFPTAGNPIDSSARLDGFIIDGADNALNIWGLEAPASPTFANCVFKNTKNPAIYLEDCSPSFLDCTFDNNNTLGTQASGGALSAWNCTVTIDRCMFRGNRASSGGAIAGGSGTVFHIANSLFSGNRSDQGGSALSVNDPLVLRNCTVVGNRALQGYGAVFGGAVTLINSILWNNQGFSGLDFQGQIDVGESLTLSNSIVQGYNPDDYWWVQGSGISSANPIFLATVNPSSAPTTTGDLRVASCSPAVDGGINSAIVGTLDLVGNPRLSGALVDMGSYEATLASLLLVTTQPIDTGGNGLAPVQFVVAVNQTNVTYQWQIKTNGDFIALTNDVNHLGTTSAILTLTNATVSMNTNEYRCHIVDTFGCAVDSLAAKFMFLSSPETLDAAMTDGQFRIQFSSTPGATFTIVGATNISLPISQWTVIGGATEISPGQFRFMESIVTNRTEQFYRVRSP